MKWLHVARVVALLAGSLLGASACDDGGPTAPQFVIDIDVESSDDGTVAITLRNTGDLTGTIVGCPDGPRTLVSRREADDWVFFGSFHEDCSTSREFRLGPDAELDYTISLPAGRYVLSVNFEVEDEPGLVRPYGSRPFDV